MSDLPPGFEPGTRSKSKGLSAAYYRNNKNLFTSQSDRLNALAKSYARGSSREHIGLTGTTIPRPLSNEHVGLNNQDNWNALIKAVKATKNSGASSGVLGSPGTGGGGPVGSGQNIAGALAAPVISNPFENPYNSIIQSAQANGTLNLEEIAKLREQIAKNYDGATQGLYDQYQGSRSELNSQATALGADSTSMYQGYDQNLRRIQENSDQSKAQDQSWFDKMTALRKTQLDSLYTGLEGEKQMQMANWQIAQAERALAAQGGGSGSSGGHHSSGGRGGRRSGGSSGSGTIKGTETATQTDTLADPNFTAIYNTITDPEVKAAFLANNILTGGNAVAAKSQQDIIAATDIANKAPGKYVGPMSPGWYAANGKWLKSSTAQTKANKNVAISAKVLQYALGLGGTAGIPKSKQTVVDKSVLKNKGK